MRDQALFDKIDLHLIRVLHTVLTERSVSRAAVRLGMHQPAVSAALKRLRDLAGDPLLVRSGASMMPTDAALRMVEPAALILRNAVSEDPEDSSRVTASLLVVDLAQGCVVAQVRPQAGQNEAARLIADGPKRACLKSGG